MNAVGQTPVTEARRVIIRHLHIDDGDAMHRIFGNAEVMRFSEGTKTRQWVNKWLRDYINGYYHDWGFIGVPSPHQFYVSASRIDVIEKCAPQTTLSEAP